MTDASDTYDDAHVDYDALADERLDGFIDDARWNELTTAHGSALAIAVQAAQDRRAAIASFARPELSADLRARLLPPARTATVIRFPWRALTAVAAAAVLVVSIALLPVDDQASSPQSPTSDPLVARAEQAKENAATPRVAPERKSESGARLRQNSSSFRRDSVTNELGVDEATSTITTADGPAAAGGLTDTIATADGSVAADSFADARAAAEPAFNDDDVIVAAMEKKIRDEATHPKLRAPQLLNQTAAPQPHAIALVWKHSNDEANVARTKRSGQPAREEELRPAPIIAPSPAIAPASSAPAAPAEMAMLAEINDQDGLATKESQMQGGTKGAAEKPAALAAKVDAPRAPAMQASRAAPRDDLAKDQSLDGADRKAEAQTSPTTGTATTSDLTIVLYNRTVSPWSVPASAIRIDALDAAGTVVWQGRAAAVGSLLVEAGGFLSLDVERADWPANAQQLRAVINEAVSADLPLNP